MRTRSVSGAILSAAILWATQPAAAEVRTQTQSPAQSQAQTQSQTQDPPLPPISRERLERIRKALEQPPQIRLENGQLRIRVEIVAKWPSFAELVKDYDLMHGPTGKDANPMSHAEFLGMVTPRHMYGSNGIRAGEVLTMALVNYFGQKIIKKGIAELREARNAQEIAEIRARIDRELAALRANGGGG